MSLVTAHKPNEFLGYLLRRSPSAFQHFAESFRNTRHFLDITGDHYRIGQSSVSHSFQSNVGILTKLSRCMACTVGLVHAKKYAAGWRQSLKISDLIIPDIRRLIKNNVEKNPCVPSRTVFFFWRNEMFRSTLQSFKKFLNHGTCQSHSSRLKCYETGANTQEPAFPKILRQNWTVSHYVIQTYKGNVNG